MGREQMPLRGMVNVPVLSQGKHWAAGAEGSHWVSVLLLLPAAPKGPQQDQTLPGVVAPLELAGLVPSFPAWSLFPPSPPLLLCPSSPKGSPRPS